jgi:NAD(P)-dependent dehydrogenase (short-subunit alcohol dehydrogenase family)
MSGILDGTAGLVTGGASGIGRATARLMAAEGASVAVADIQDSGAAETVAMITASGGRAVALHADMAEEREIAAMVASTAEAFGRLDWAFNNAAVFGSAVGAIGFTHEISADSFDRLMRIDLRGVFLCMKYELGEMAKQRRGSVVNTSSIAGLRGLGGSAIYTAAKHGVVGLTRAAAMEYAGLGIRVNAVCPGWVRTERFNAQFNRDWEAQMLTATPAGRMGDVDEIAQTVAWLCSGRASFVNGQAIAVDGGFTGGPSLAVFTGGSQESLRRVRAGEWPTRQ